MELEINIEDLLSKRRIESDRIEFKASWNPDDIYRSICAFANDFDNVGGGYILIGVEEQNGVAVRPVKGIQEYEIDAIKKEMIGYNNTMVPACFPKVIDEEVDGKCILVLWVTTGAGRPYKAPEHVTSKKEKKLYYYIRYASSSIRANAEQERELLSMTDYMPFDMKPNFKATEDDISVPLLIEHLKKTKSRLARQVLKRGVMDVLGDMQLLVGPPEQPYITNVALMMFCDHLDQFFPYTQVEITKFPEGSIRNPNNFIEVPVIKGSVPEMINRTMQKLQDMVILEKVTKVNYQMEAIRRFNYPYQALEEAVVNAFYHRDYLSYQSIIIEIEPELIRIISYPGIDRSIPMRDIEAGERFSTRYYRNKRLGEFLKELDLSEGKCTGIPTIQEELRNNGSPSARFYTDDDRRAVTVEIRIHPDFLGLDDSMTVSEEKKIVSSAKMTASDEKPAHSDGNLPVDGEKSCVSDSNATSEDGESIVSPEKVSFEDEEKIVSTRKVSVEKGQSID
ncbi:MAG: putative DNA binding domain-containing protein [Lachnospiraceae bacterium]|nr:putative DNA binding domain-containing protein [Lachnospiraceae bacterium]